MGIARIARKIKRMSLGLLSFCQAKSSRDVLFMPWETTMFLLSYVDLTSISPTLYWFNASSVSSCWMNIFQRRFLWIQFLNNGKNISYSSCAQNPVVWSTCCTRKEREINRLRFTVMIDAGNQPLTHAECEQEKLCFQQDVKSECEIFRITKVLYCNRDFLLSFINFSPIIYPPGKGNKVFIDGVLSLDGENVRHPICEKCLHGVSNP